MQKNEEIKELMEVYSVNKDVAEEIFEVMDDFGLDSDDAYEIWESVY